MPLSPRLKLRSARPGSLDVRLIIDAAAAIAPIAPSIFGESWKLFKAGYDLVKLAVEHFNQNGYPVSISITDSPNALVVQVGGDVVVSNDILEVARRNHKWLDRIAGFVRRQKANVVSLESDCDPDDQPSRMLFDRSNKDSFNVGSIETIEPIPVEFECNIFRLNVRSLSGLLEYLGGEAVPETYSFEILDDLVEDCIDALRRPRVKATASREVYMNALGEKKIKRFRLLSIETIDDLE